MPAIYASLSGPYTGFPVTGSTNVSTGLSSSTCGSLIPVLDGGIFIGALVFGTIYKGNVFEVVAGFAGGGGGGGTYTLFVGGGVYGVWVGVGVVLGVVVDGGAYALDGVGLGDGVDAEGTFAKFILGAYKLFIIWL